MPKIEAPTFTVNVDWEPSGNPVILVTGSGVAQNMKNVLDVIRLTVDTIDAGPHDHVCTVYNMLSVRVPINLPQLGHMIRNKEIPSSAHTAHIILGTTSAMLRLMGTIIAVTGSKDVRTVDVCASQAEIDQAITSWLALPMHIRNFTTGHPL